MNRPLKTFDETLADEMKDPEFRLEFLQRQADLDAFERIREIRLSSGLTREAIAKRMGKSPSTVDRIERDLSCDRWPSVRALQAYAQALGKKLEIRFV